MLSAAQRQVKLARKAKVRKQRAAEWVASAYYDPSAEEEGGPWIGERWWMPNGVYSRPLHVGKRPLVLKTIIKEAVKYGRCSLPIEKIAELAMCNTSTVRTTLKIVLDANLISIAPDKNIFLAPDWLAYLRKTVPMVRHYWW